MPVGTGELTQRQKERDHLRETIKREDQSIVQK